MPKFAANLSFLFADAPFPERFRRAAAAGFTGVEYLFPYDWPAHDVAEWLRDGGSRTGAVQPAAPATGRPASAAWPACRTARASSSRASSGRSTTRCCSIAAACTAWPGCGRRVCPRRELEATYVANLRHAADRLATIGATVTIEPINSRIDMPGYWLDSIDKGFRLLEAVDRSNVKLQYDIYHAQIIAGDLARTLEGNIDRIGHIQIADNPGRHEPGTGEINYPFLFDLLDRLGYDGWVGCEYKPLTTTEAGLGWRPR